jgi:hypothetical protein
VPVIPPPRKDILFGCADSRIDTLCCSDVGGFWSVSCGGRVVASVGGWIGVEEEKRLKEANNATSQTLECGK